MIIESHWNAVAIKLQMFKWLETNHMYMYEHPIQSMNVEFSRIGYLQGKHYLETYRIDLQDKINASIYDYFTNMSSSEISNYYVNHMPGYKKGDTMNFPKIRVITLTVKSKYKKHEVASRALVIESLRTERQLVLSIMPKIFPDTEKNLFIPFGLPYDKNIPQAAKVYHLALMQHRHTIDNLYSFAVLSVSEEMMHYHPEGKQSLYQELQNEETIESVERTPGTNRVGKWVIITQAKHRETAETLVDGKISALICAKPDLAIHESDPRQIQSTTLPFKYVTALVKDDTNQQWDKDQGKESASQTVTTAVSSVTSLTSTESRLDSLSEQCNKISNDFSETMKTFKETNAATEAKNSDHFEQLTKLLVTQHASTTNKLEEISTRQQIQEEETAKLKTRVSDLEEQVYRLQTLIGDTPNAGSEHGPHSMHRVCPNVATSNIYLPCCTHPLGAEIRALPAW